MTQTPAHFKTFEQLAADVKGKWSYIYGELAPELDEAMAAVGSRGPAQHVSCPVHGGSDGFRLYNDFHETGGGICNTCGGFRDGFKLLAWIRNYTRKDAVRDVGKWDRQESNTIVPRERPAPKPFVAKDPAKAYRDIREVWLASKPLKGTPAERYLLNRGIWQANHPSVLRYHPGLRYYDKDQQKITGTYPCLLAPIKAPDGRLLSVHRIYITNDGKKAPVAECKKMMSPVAEMPGAAIKLFEPGTVLGVAEGIETALAAHAISRMPVWSCVNTSLLKNLAIPEGVKTLVIWADKDRKPEKGPEPRIPPGEVAANKLAARAQALGITVEIHYPPLPIPENSKGVDWLDALLSLGVDAFPERWRRFQATPAAIAA